MIKNPFARRSTRNRAFALVTAVGILLLLALNVLAAGGTVFSTVYADLTPEGLYTLTPEMIEACEFLSTLGTDEDAPVSMKVTFCTDRDYLIENETTRAVYFMALSLARRFPNFTVEAVNAALDPSAVAQYKTTSLSEIQPTDVIISYGGRYRIASAASFWLLDTDGETVISFYGERKLASLMLSLASVTRPVAYFVTGHGETYYDPDAPTSEGSLATAALYDMLTECGMTVKTLDLTEVEAVPEDCILLIINDPTSDLVVDESRLDEYSYLSETEKIDRYVISRSGALMVAKDPARHLPVLEDYLREWGVAFTDTIVKDRDNSLADEDGSGTSLIGQYNTDTDSYAYQIYGEFADLLTSPRTIIPASGAITNAYGDAKTIIEAGAPNTERTFVKFMASSEQANEYAIAADGSYTDRPAGEEGARTLATLSVRSYLDPDLADTYYSYVFCAASGQFFSNDVLGNAAYANYDVFSALVRNITRSETYASSSLGDTVGKDKTNYLGKLLVSTTMSETDSKVYSDDGRQVVKINYGLTTGATTAITVVACLIPLAIGVAGVVVYLRRKYR